MYLRRFLTWSLRMLKVDQLSALRVTLLLMSVFFSTFIPVEKVLGATTVELGSGTLDHDRVLGVRWTRVNFSVQASGMHSIQVNWDGDADIRFSVFQVVNTPQTTDSIGIALNNRNEWTGVLSDSEQYFLGIWSASGTAIFTATIEAESPDLTPLVINTQPDNQSLTEGESASFSVAASGDGTLGYQWFENDAAIAGATTDTLVVNSITLALDGNVYRVEITDENSSISSDNVTLFVTEAEEVEEAVTVVTFGQGTLDSDRVAGPRFQRLPFDSLASAVHTIRVAWDSDADVRFNVLSPNGSRLNSITVRDSNPGVWVGELDANEQYSIGLWSVDGIANYTASVEAIVPFSISEQPSSIRVTEGMDAQFTVVAAGSDTISYQWFADGVLLPGEVEDTLTVFATALFEDGTAYSVDVSNDTSTIHSDIAILSVDEPATIGPYSQEADSSTWILDGPAPTLDFNVAVEDAGWARVLLRLDDLLLVGGDYTGIRPNRGGPITNRPWLAALNAVSGQPVSSFQVPSQIDSVVRALALSPSGTEVYVGGDFGFLALDAVTGELNFSVNITDGQTVGRVFDIAVTQTQVYIGGDFTRVDDTFRNNIARLSLDGELDGTWSPNVRNGFSSGREAPVQSITVSPSGDALYVGGNFGAIDDTTVPLSNQGTTVSMLVLDTSEGASVRAERFTPNVTNNIGRPVRARDIAVTDDYVIVAWGGPNFLTFHALDGTRLRQYDATGDVQALQLAGNLVFVGHHGEFFGDILSPIPQEAVQSLNPEIIRPFELHSFRVDDPTFPPEQAWEISGFFGVWGISVAEDSVWVGGQIFRAGSSNREIDGLVRFPALQ